MFYGWNTPQIYPLIKFKTKFYKQRRNIFNLIMLNKIQDMCSYTTRENIGQDFGVRSFNYTTLEIFKGEFII